MVQGRKIVILDVDMIMTDVLFRINNIDPFAQQTFDSVFPITDIDLKTLAEKNILEHDKIKQFFCETIDYTKSSIANDFLQCRDIIDKSEFHIVILTKVYEELFSNGKQLEAKKTFIENTMREYFENASHEIHFVPFNRSKFDYLGGYPYIGIKDICIVVDDNLENLIDLVGGYTVDGQKPLVLYPKRLEWMRPKHSDDALGSIRYY